MTLLVFILTAVVLAEAAIIALGVRYLLTFKKRLEALVASPAVRLGTEAVGAIQSLKGSVESAASLLTGAVPLLIGKAQTGPETEEAKSVLKDLPETLEDLVKHFDGSKLLARISERRSAGSGPYSDANAGLHSRLQTSPAFVRDLKRLQNKYPVHTKTYQTKIYPLIRRHAKRLGLDLTGTSAELPKPKKAD